jgi:hypothetical protein
MKNSNGSGIKEWNNKAKELLQEDESSIPTNPTSIPTTTHTTSMPTSSSTSSPGPIPSLPPRKVKSLNDIYGYSNFFIMSHIEEEPRFFEDTVK